MQAMTATSQLIYYLSNIVEGKINVHKHLIQM